MTQLDPSCSRCPPNTISRVPNVFRFKHPLLVVQPDSLSAFRGKSAVVDERFTENDTMVYVSKQAGVLVTFACEAGWSALRLEPASGAFVAPSGVWLRNGSRDGFRPAKHPEDKPVLIFINNTFSFTPLL